MCQSLHHRRGNRHKSLRIVNNHVVDVPQQFGHNRAPRARTCPRRSQIEQLFDDYPTLRRQRELLISIPGIGESTAARILGEMPNIAEFRDVKAVAA